MKIAILKEGAPNPSGFVALERKCSKALAEELTWFDPQYHRIIPDSSPDPNPDTKLREVLVLKILKDDRDNEQFWRRAEVSLAKKEHDREVMMNKKPPRPKTKKKVELEAIPSTPVVVPIPPPPTTALEKGVGDNIIVIQNDMVIRIDPARNLLLQDPKTLEMRAVHPIFDLKVRLIRYQKEEWLITRKNRYNEGVGLTLAQWQKMERIPGSGIRIIGLKYNLLRSPQK